MALAWLAQSGLEWAADLAPVQHAIQKEETGSDRLQVLRRQLETGLNSPPTSSMGRLFDAAAALMGIRQEISYEAQAAIEMEALADPAETGYYPLELLKDGNIDPAPLWQSLLTDLRRGIPVSVISARFHNSLAHIVSEVCLGIRQQTGLNRVALSGGVWQNMYLPKATCGALAQGNFEIMLHRQTPPNDGGLALGQVAVGAARLMGQDRR
jgi:hydrogenase maturation protein HypF